MYIYMYIQTGTTDGGRLAMGGSAGSDLLRERCVADLLPERKRNDDTVRSRLIECTLLRKDREFSRLRLLWLVSPGLHWPSARIFRGIHTCSSIQTKNKQI